MLSPPLQLERSLVDRLLLETNPAFASGMPRQPRGRWNTQLQQSADNPQLWRVALGLLFEPDEEHSGPYRIEMSIVGFFRLPDGLGREDAARLVGITGASILYSAAREHVLLVTGRGAWGAFQLPTIRFPQPDVSTQVGAESVVDAPQAVVRSRARRTEKKTEKSGKRPRRGAGR